MTVEMLKAHLPTSEMAKWMGFYLYRENRREQDRAKKEMVADMKKRVR